MRRAIASARSTLNWSWQSAFAVASLAFGVWVSSAAAQPGPAVVVKAPESACAALSGKIVPASEIGEPTTGAVVTSATYRLAAADRPDPRGRGITQATPDYCELKIDIRPVDPAAPLIKSQVNLPTRWNGKKLQFGGSGYNGFLQTGVQPTRNAGPEVPLPLTLGYLTAGTDSGHQLTRGGPGGEAAGDNPQAGGNDNYGFAANNEALANYAYAAYKKTHDVAKRLAVLYYGRAPTRSYYMGGSEGGREAMTMAQRYPNDYDGIVAIDPVMNFSGLQTWGNYLGGILQNKPGAWIGPKWRLVADTVIQACDAADGIADKVVSNYLACKPVAARALDAKRCPSGNDEGPACFSDGQLAAIRVAHDGYHFPFTVANGMTRYAGIGFGGEGLANNWSRSIAGTAPPSAGPDSEDVAREFQLGAIYVRYFIARNGKFDPLTYDPANFKARVLEVSEMIDATNPDLSAFYAHGGKLILRADLADAGESSYSGLDYWDAVVAKMGRAKVDQFFAAFVATGLPHTSGGILKDDYAPPYGIPGRVDLLAPLEDWVERGIKPADRLTLVNRNALPPYDVIASKPMCRYGAWPKFVGKEPLQGSDAANYDCIPYR